MTYTEKAIAGTWYTITCTAAATVTQEIEGETATLATLGKSGTTTFRASASTITIQTEGKYHILPTKAPAALVGDNSSGGDTTITGWYEVLRSELDELLGAGNYKLAYAWRDDKFTMTLAVPLDITDEQMAQVRVLLGSIPPRNLVAEMEWADGLPMSYTRLECIESTGTQYINTAITATSDSEIAIDVMPMKYGSDEGLVDGFNINMIYGTDSDNSVPGHFISFNYNGGYGGQTYVKYGTNRKYMGAGSKLEKGRRYLLQQIKEQFYIDNKLFGEFTYSEFSDAFTLIIFGVLSKDLAFYGSRIRVYGVSLKDDSQKINFVPALAPTGVPCMFDTVTRKPFYNSGTGQFIAGIETQKQLNAVLSGLPDLSGQNGGELHLRLSDALYESAVASGIIETTATSKNWQIAYDPTTEIAA